MIPFSFAAPSLLWFLLPLTGTLLYVYLRRGIGKEIQVSSVLFLKKLTAPLSSRKKFTIPLRLFFELLLFALLLLSLAKLSLESKGKHIAIIIDNSLSMRAADGFERSKAAAISAVSDKELSSTYEVIVATQDGISIESLTQSDAIKKIQDVKISNLEDSIEAVIKRTIKDKQFDEILVFSDKKISSDDSRVLSYPQKNKPLSNISVTNGELVNERLVRATLHAYSVVSGEARVDIRNAITDEILGSEKAKFRGGETFSVDLNLTNIPKEPLRIHAISKLEGSESDSLDEDNYFWISSETKKLVTGVLSDLSLEELGLTSLPSQNFIKLTSIEEAHSLSSLLIHRKIVPTLPETSTVVVLPEGDGVFKGETFREEGAVTSWEAGHPILSYLNIPSLKLREFERLSGPSWLSPILTSQKGPLALVGELKGKRYAAIGFEIFPFEGKKSLFTGVFTLNILKWVFQQNFSSESLLVGGKPRNEKAISEIKFLIPNPRDYWKRSEDSTSPPPFDSSGIIETKTIGEKKNVLAAVNIISPGESNLLQVEEIMIRKDFATRAEAVLDSGGLNLTKALTIALLILLLFDCVLLFTKSFSFIVLSLRFLSVTMLSITLFSPYMERLESVNSAAVLIDISESHDEAVADDLLANLKTELPPDSSLTLIPFGKKSESLFEHSLPSSLSSIRKRFGALDPGQTNIESALGEALTSNAHDIVLISDGFETGGDAFGIVKSLESKSARVFPFLPKGSTANAQAYRISNLHVPLRAPLGKSVDIRISIENSTSTQQVGALTVTHDGAPVFAERVTIQPGASQVVVAKSDASKEGIKEIVATLSPEEKSLPKSSAHALLSGETKDRVLLLSGTDADERFLKDVLTQEAFKLSSTVGDSPDLSELSGTSTVILNNISLDSLSRSGASTIRSFVQNGGGLIMIGGNKSFGLGGYIGSPLEEVLPVRLVPPQSEKKRLNIAVQLVLDKSRSMASDGKLDSTKAAAKEVIHGLKDDDLVGVTAFDSSPFAVVPLATLSQNRKTAMDRVGILFPTGKTNLMPAMDIARQSLESARAGRKHMIVLTDGELPDGSPAYVEFVKQMRFSGITVSTVLIGPEFDTLLRRMAEVGGGAFYNTSDPSTLPRIFLRDIQVRSGEQTMKENIEYFVRVGPGKLNSSTIRTYPSLLGYVQTLEKEGSNLELVTIADEKADPLLASGTFGQGKVIAFTSDTNGRWSKSWVPWGNFRTFWRELVQSSQNEKATDTVRYDLKYYVERGSLVIDLTVLSGTGGEAVMGELIHPDKTKETITFSQISEGHFKAESQNASAGAYEFKGKVGTAALSSVGLYVSGEYFGEKKGKGYNVPFLEALASRTGGKTNPKTSDFLSGGGVKIIKESLVDLFLWAALVFLLLEILIREDVLRFRSRSLLNRNIKHLRRTVRSAA